MAVAEDQIKVNISSVSSVAPAVPTVKHRMFLSTFDLGSLVASNMRMLLFYKTDKEFSTIVENLKRSLSLVLVDFYPFAGRLDMKRGESGRPELDCNDGGVEFVEASINRAFQDLENNDFQHNAFFNQLVRTRHQHCDASILSIQVTAFVRNGICMGVNSHHVVADGISFWRFMKCWADCSRGLPILEKPDHMKCWADCSRGLPILEKPDHMRTIFKRDNVIPNVSLKAKPVLTDRSAEAQIFTLMRDDSLPVKHSSNTGDVPGEEISKNSMINIQNFREEDTGLEISTFHFRQSMIQNLKERSGASSSLVAVSAHLWRSVMKARRVPEKEPVGFELVADGRDRVKPPLSPTYFGNCVSMGIGRTTAKQLFEQDIGFAAALIQEIINSCTREEHINNQIEWAESHLQNKRGRVIPFGHVVDIRYKVCLINSPKFPVYEIDHGFGSPSNVQEAFMNLCNLIGAIFLLPGRDGTSICVSTQLPHHQMETLKQIVMIIPD